MSETSSPAAPPSEAPPPRVNVAQLWFSLSAPVSRRAYLISGIVLMAFKYAVDAGLAVLATGKFFSPLDYINPILALRSKALTVPGEPQPDWLLFAMVVWALPFMWIGLSMTMRRAVDAGKSPWLALLFFVPGVNYILMLVLATLPSKQHETWPKPAPTEVVVDERLKSGVLGVAAGLAIASAMSGLSIFAIGEYGASLFLGTPLVMGVVGGYIHNRKHVRKMTDTIVVACTSMGLTALGFIMFALEGALCLAMAFPIAAGVGIAGAIVGRAIAIGNSSKGAKAAGAGAMITVFSLPVLCGAEAALFEPAEYEVVTVREIDAPPAVVWQNVVSFSELPSPSEWFFDAGIAYPLRARIEGTGVGAIRHCEFSTGPFIEPITTWDEPRRLSFDVVSQPMPMKEWSPYKFVNAPHLHDALRSQRGEFRLVALDGGTRTRLEGSTWYVLDMAPNAYWRVWSEWLLHSIHDRVLGHIETLSERAASP